MKLNINFEKI